jgi:hypothetical protein
VARLTWRNVVGFAKGDLAKFSRDPFESARHAVPEPHAGFGGQRQSMITRLESERSLAVFPVGIRTHLASILALPARQGDGWKIRRDTADEGTGY